jgi:hypothetical protein
MLSSFRAPYSYSCEVVLTDSTSVVTRYCVITAGLEVDQIPVRHKKRRHLRSPEQTCTESMARVPSSVFRYIPHQSTTLFSRQQLYPLVCCDARWLLSVYQ